MWILRRKLKKGTPEPVGDPEAWSAVERSYEKLQDAQTRWRSVREIVSVLHTYREENGFADMILASFGQPPTPGN